MRNTTFRIIKFSLGIAVLTATLGNSGCLVQPGSDLDKLVKLDQAHLRIYQVGDRLRYDVLVDGVTKGTLTIVYDQPANLDEQPRENPFDTASPPRATLRETTTLAYPGNQIQTVRFITQENDPASPTYGSMTLYAFPGQAATTDHNYVSTGSTANIDTPLVPATIFSSPFLDTTTYQPIPGQSNENIDYYVYPCYEKTNPGNCDPYNQHLQENFELSSMKVYNLNTNVDFFETVQVPFTGTVDSVAGSTDLRKIDLDFRTFCRLDPSDTTITYSGSEFLYPSIGAVRFEVNCTSTSAPYHFLSADLTSVNFSY